tara:strand:+ start:15661 stop:17091 length:1431 start_codon:yes stop_codon:yes gene_type:complete
MAIFFLRMNPVSRLKKLKTGKVIKQSATAGAAYRAAEKIIDQRTGLVADYSNRTGVIDTMMFNNKGLSRSELWNLSELSNPRKNSRVARETIVALPHELSTDSYKTILADYALALVDRYGVAVDVAIHTPGREGDHRNFHAHIYCTTQVMKEDGTLGKKVEIEWSDTNLRKASLPTGKEQLLAIKQLWEKVVNQEFERLGMNERIDHKFEVNGDRIAQIHAGPHATSLARRGRGHESDEWQINQAIIAFNNVASIGDARNKKMQNTVTKNTAPEVLTQAIKFGGLSGSEKAAEEAVSLAKKKQQQNKELMEREHWKPAQIDSQKGAVISMFQQDSQGVYRWSKGKNEGAEAFRDAGKAIHSQTSNAWALAAELELAQQKKNAGEWKEIRAFGSEEYRRAVWIQGQTMSIQVEGYKPSKEELAKYGQNSSQGLVGDQKSLSQNRFMIDPKFQNKFEQKSSVSNPLSIQTIPARSPKV